MLRSLTFLSLGLGIFASAALAQSVDPLLEQERLRKLEARTNRLGSLEQRGGPAPVGPAQASGGPCFQIDTLTVEGATLLPAGTIASIIGGAVPGCLEGADIQRVIRGIDAAYADRGLITSKTYVPPQNIASGTLILAVTEGFIEDILLTDSTQQIDTARGDRQLGTAFPGQDNRPFQLRDFEQGLDQMNRLKSVDATLQLQPGDTPGGSYVIVQRIQDDPVRGYVRLDDLGADASGRRKLSFDLEVDDLLGANDILNIGYVGSRESNALNIQGSVPWGYFTFGANLALSEYLSPLTAFTELFGQTRSIGANVRYIAKRDQFTTTELVGALELRKSDRFINGLALTPQNLTTFDIGMTHLRLTPKARVSFDGTLTLGTTLFGATRDSADPTAPKAQFVKLLGGAQRQAGLGTFGTLVNDLRVQISPDILFGAEQMVIGSYTTVRGYDQSIAAGDSGFYMRNDLYLSTDSWSFLDPAISASLQPYLFADLGMVRDRAARQSTKAAGAGFGASYYAKRYTLSGLVGVPLVDGAGAASGNPVIQVRMDFKLF
jgi:hemolysin activation/secretion protein